MNDMNLDAHVTMVAATMTVKVPLYGARDLIELRMVMVNGQEEVHSGGQVFQRIAS